MKMIKLIASDNEDDVWNYKPSAKTIKAKTSNNTIRLNDHSTRSMKKSSSSPHVLSSFSNKPKQTKKSSRGGVNTKLVKKIGNPNKILTRTKYDGYCPNCQMPFNILILQTPTWHLTECELKKMSSQECPHGIQCYSSIESHYRKFAHSTLAKSRKYSTQPASALKCKSTSLNTASCKWIKGSDEECKNIKFIDLEGNCCDNYTGIDDSRTSEGKYIMISFPSGNGDDVSSNDELLSNKMKEYDSIQAQTSNFQLTPKSRTGTSEPLAFSVSTPLLDLDNQVLSSNVGEDYLSDSDVFDSVAYTEVRNQLQKQNLETDIDCLMKSGSKCHIIQKVPGNDYSPVESNLQQHSILCSPQKQLFMHQKEISVLSRGKIDGTISSAVKQVSLRAFFKVKPSKTSTELQCSGSLTDVKKYKKTEMQNVTLKQDYMFHESHKSNANDNATSSKYTKNCPFYKKIPGTGFTVDAFSYGVIPHCSIYFLSHFHYDHYAGLKKNFNKIIYCSKVTGNLVKKKIKVDAQFIKELHINEGIDIEGTCVTALEANHCPGAILLLFHLRDGRIFLHTGDFRAHSSMEDYPQLQNIHINQLYLDTTYCDPAYAFPPQEDMIKLAVDISKNAAELNHKTLFICGTYTIGKERIFLAIAAALNTTAFVLKDKKNILDCLEDPQVHRITSISPIGARVHIIQMNKLNFKDLSAHLEKHQDFNEVVAFKPTGWTHSKHNTSSIVNSLTPKSNGPIKIYGIPYSEHSSYSEMKRFVQFIKPAQILPTVNNGNPKLRKKMKDIFESWINEHK